MLSHLTHIGPKVASWLWYWSVDSSSLAYFFFSLLWSLQWVTIHKMTGTPSINLLVAGYQYTFPWHWCRCRTVRHRTGSSPVVSGLSGWGNTVWVGYGHSQRSTSGDMYWRLPQNVLHEGLQQAGWVSPHPSFLSRSLPSSGQCLGWSGTSVSWPFSLTLIT